MSKLKVESYVYEKVKKTDVEINIPQEPVYFQEHNHRVVVGLFPKYSTWQEGNPVWKIDVVEVTDKTIQRAVLRISERNLSDIISRFDYKGKSQEDYLIDKAVMYLKDRFTDDRISAETFHNKYVRFLRKISEARIYTLEGIKMEDKG